MEPLEKVLLLRELACLRGQRQARLQALGLPKSTYYNWKHRYESEGINGLANMGNKGKATWNRLTLEERAKVLEVARGHPELSCRLLAVKITDEEAFTISEATVYRLLKQAGLVCLRSGYRSAGQEGVAA